MYLTAYWHQDSQDIFIEQMNIILKGFTSVDVVADERLESVLKRTQEVGLRLNPSKSQICKVEVPLITDHGLKLNPDRV